MTRIRIAIILLLLSSINAFHLPIQRGRSTRALSRRAGNVGSVGLGDVADITYNVLITVGSIQTPVVLDTGSSDLWLLSDACEGRCTKNVPLYPHTGLNYSGSDVLLLYGDSYTGTRASGPIGQDIAGVAGLTMPNQYFAAINNTNTSILETGSAGILGLGFPINSVIFETLFTNAHPALSSQKRDSTNDLARSDFPNLPSILSRRPPRRRNSRLSRLSANHPRQDFPQLPSSFSSNPPPTTLPLHTRQQQQQPSSSPTIDDVLSSFTSMGPLISRMAQSGQIPSPQFSLTLQRNAIEVGGNVGMLSVGELPPGVSNDSLTWVPIRGYTKAQGGLPPPPEAPNEIYPIAWEVPIDDVFLDGVALPRSNLSSSSISPSDPPIQLTGLIDSGNSLIRGPQDVVNTIYARITDSEDSLKQSFSCNTPHTLAFKIGGKMFPVDPRDFITQELPNRVDRCIPNIVATDPPGVGYLYSWSLGDPFLKSVLSSFYYGNLTRPSTDPPRVGFLSTVPSTAPAQLNGAVSAAFYNNGGNFPTTSVTAPSNVPTNQPGYGVVVLNAATAAGSSSGVVGGSSTKNKGLRTSSPAFFSSLSIVVTLTVFIVLL